MRPEPALVGDSPTERIRSAESQCVSPQCSSWSAHDGGARIRTPYGSGRRIRPVSFDGHHGTFLCGSRAGSCTITDPPCLLISFKPATPLLDNSDSGTIATR